jgi:hypothetical protein
MFGSHQETHLCSDQLMSNLSTKPQSPPWSDVSTILYSLDSMLNPLHILNGWAHLGETHMVEKRLMRAFERW